MNPTEGLFDHMVLQRNAKGVSQASVSGDCASSGTVYARVTAKGRVVRGFKKATIGTASGSTFKGEIKGIPAGGPYELELSIVDRKGIVEATVVKDVLVGDVWLLAGQSNMEGCGLRTHAARPNREVRAFYMDDSWDVARDPIHNRDKAVDAIHCELSGGVLPPPNRIAGVGPGVAFGIEMRRRTGVPQGLIACAHGGTSMEQWDPGKKSLGGGSLYGALVRRLRKNGNKVAGVFWYQGCSDANKEAAAVYTQRMKALIRAFRRDARDSKLPIVIVQISRVIGWPDDADIHWNSIQEQQRRLPERIRNTTIVPTIDLTLDDGIHISGRGQQRLGRRGAFAMEVLRRGRKAGRPPIAIGRIQVKKLGDRPVCKVVIDFRNVVGSLRAPGRPAGFVVNDGKSGNLVYDIQLRGARAHVYVGLTADDATTRFITYGFGTNPHCNITDDADRSLPVFVGSPLGRKRRQSN